MSDSQKAFLSILQASSKKPCIHQSNNIAKKNKIVRPREKRGREVKRVNGVHALSALKD